MPSGRLPGEVFRACPTGRRLRGRPRPRWRDYISWLAWERLGVLSEELVEVAGEREVWVSLLKLLPPRPEARTSGGDSVRTSGDLTAQSGASLTIPCFYDQKYKDHVKYWCKGYYWNSCSTLARSDSNQTAGKVSISDDPTHLVFNVTMRNLHETDSDTYWCAVEIHGAADDGVYLQLTVMEAEGVSPKQAELTTSLQQTETFTSSTQRRDGFTSATNHPTGWAVTTCPAGALTSTTNENLNTTQSPRDHIWHFLLHTAVGLVYLLCTGVAIITWRNHRQ